MSTRVEIDDGVLAVQATREARATVARVARSVLRHRPSGRRSFAGLFHRLDPRRDRFRGLLGGALCGLVTIAASCRQAAGTPEPGRDPGPRAPGPSTANSPTADFPAADFHAARFFIAAGDAALAAGRLDEAKNRYEQAISLAHEQSAAAEEVLALNQRGVLAERLGALEDARDHYLRALDLQQVAPVAGVGVEESRLRANLAGVLAALGDTTGAEAHLTRALEQVELDRNPATGGAVYRQLGRVRIAAGHAPDGLGALAVATTLFERAGLHDEAARTRLERGLGLLAQDDAHAAIGELSRATQQFASEETRGVDVAVVSITALEALARCYESIAQPRWSLPFRERAVAKALRQPDVELRRAVLTRALAAAQANGRAELAAAWRAELDALH